MVTNENKTKMIDALKQLDNAMQKISELWETDVNLDELTDHGKKYPFKCSFDEVSASVSEWVSDTIEEIADL